MMKRILSVILCAVMLLSMLVSCQEPVEPNAETTGATNAVTTAEPEVTEKITYEETTAAKPEPEPVVYEIPMADVPKYVVIYSNDATEEELALAKRVAEAMSTQFSCTIPYKADTVAISSHEIIVGETTRMESSILKDNLKYEGFGFMAIESAIAIAGSEDFILPTAIESFLNMCVTTVNPANEMFYTSKKDRFMVPSGTTYKHSNITINGVDAADYSIVYPKDSFFLADYAEKIQRRFGEDCGALLNIYDDSKVLFDHVILLGDTSYNVDTSLLGNKTDAGMIDIQKKKLLLYGNTVTGAASAGEALLDALNALDKDSTELTVEPKVVPNIDEKGTVTAMSFNIYTVITKGHPRTERALDCIVDYLPDIVGLQEADETWYSEIQKLSEYYHIVGHGRESVLNSDGTVKFNLGEATYIMFAKEKFELLDGGTKWLSNTPDVKSMYPGQSYLRVFTWTKLKRVSDGQIFVHCNTHFDFNSDIQMLEAQQIMNYIKENSQYPVSFSGDFNLRKGSSPYTYIVRNNFYDPSVVSDAYKNINYQSIDFVFLSQEFCTSSYYEVVIRGYHEPYADSFERDGKVSRPGWVSDHYPVYVEFSLK
jgi:endonuclease/exonuclease/phosphatase family metal-dependent hydrolase